MHRPAPHPAFHFATARRAAAGAAACGAILLSTLAFGQPAKEPLLTRSTVVRPNLMFILDDSGSMGSSEVFARHYTLATGSCGSIKYAEESPINNALFYDSTKRYEPGFDDNGVQLPNAVQTGTWSTLDIFLPKTGANIPSLTTKEGICNAALYDLVEVRTSQFRVNGIAVAAGVNPLPGSLNRSDCAGAVCTLVEEKQNITNWRTFHKNRIKAAKTGVAKAFATQPDTFRLGYTTIHVAAADGSGSGNLKLWGVKDYFLAKSDFFSWLNNLAVADATPLRKALDIAGQYYSRSDSAGPWAHSPWKPGSDGEAAGDHLSCRRNFNILVTDGEWNGSAAPTLAARGNIDGTNGLQITHADGVTKYQYIPRDGDTRSKGKADKTIPTTDYANTLADVAMYYWVRDLRADLPNNVTPGKQTDRPFWQNITAYTAAFGPVGKLTAAQIRDAKAGALNWTSVAPEENLPETIDDLIHAAHNTGGEFLTLTDAASFASELGRVVGSIAGSEQFSQAGVAASAVTLTAGTRKFVPYYTSNQWWGNVKMINLAANGDETGVAWEAVETDSLGKPTGNARIAPHASRGIYTWTPGTKGMPFTWANLSPALVASSLANNTATLLHSSITPHIVDYLRGSRELEADGMPLRKREALLGDIINSTPVFIKNNSNFGYERLPAATAGFSSYGAYMAAKLGRAEGVLFIGANDGMLHALREGASGIAGGEETFAYVPRGVFGNLHELASKSYQHRYYVDGPLSESDAYITAPNLSGVGDVKRWANLVLGSTGAGGRSLFALDATQPLAMGARSILWEVNAATPGMSELGYVMNQVESGITASGDWVAIVGNGPYGGSGRAYLFVLDLATGAVLKQIETNADTGNGLGGVRVVRNANGMIIGAYAGDLKGNVWRFDLSSASKASWPSSAQLLYTATDGAGAPRPITATPGVVPRPDDLGGYMVIVGTGKLYDENDHLSTQVQGAYGLWDKATFGGTASFSTVPNLASLVPVTVNLDTSIPLGTSTINPESSTTYYKATAARTVDWTIDRGWFINYDLTAGQRTVFSIEPTKKVVRVDTIAPRVAQVSCAAGVSPGFNYLLSPLTGTCRSIATFDTDKDGAFDDSKDSNACIYSTEADGEDVVLDILNIDGTSSEFVDIQDSRGHVKARVGDPPPAAPTPSIRGKRTWRQLFMRRN